MNPYKSPTNRDQTAPPRVDSAPERIYRRFRWRVIPACISWCLGGLWLLAVPVGVYNNWKYLTIDFEAPLSWVLLDVLMLALFPIMLAAGLSFFLAGNRWMKGRWGSAIALNVVPLLMMICFVFLTDYLRGWAVAAP